MIQTPAALNVVTSLLNISILGLVSIETDQNVPDPGGFRRRDPKLSDRWKLRIRITAPASGTAMSISLAM